MKASTSTIAAALLLGGLNFVPHAYGELPELEEKDWTGCFAGHLDKNIKFTISTTGAMVISPINAHGDPGAYVKMPIDCALEVTMPNGQKRLLEPLPESLESDDEVTSEFEETVIRGKFEGDAAFELMVEQKRGVISVGGRLTAPGTYKPESIRFVVSAQILNFYGRKKMELENDPKAFEELISENYVKLKWTSGKRQKLEYIEPIDMNTEEVNGPGVSDAEIWIKAINRKYIYEATEDSSFRFSNRNNLPLHTGMTVTWSPDQGKDPKAEARLDITVK
ncbi:hypothetical protein [Haloferula sp.]|uniref:hypothetical protein n=1 Tax=Haloferula sp. TaxID=2497595 RepID=UPI00329BBADA